MLLYVSKFESFTALLYKVNKSSSSKHIIFVGILYETIEYLSVEPWKSMIVKHLHASTNVSGLSSSSSIVPYTLSRIKFSKALFFRNLAVVVIFRIIDITCTLLPLLAHLAVFSVPSASESISEGVIKTSASVYS